MSDNTPAASKTPASESTIEALLRSRSRASSASIGAETDEFSLISGGARMSTRSTSESAHVGLGTFTGGGLRGKNNSTRPELLSLVTDIPVTASSERTNLDEELKSPRPSAYQLYLVTTAMLESKEICGGIIKSAVYGDSFCLKNPRNCSSASHKVNKHESFLANTVYIVGLTTTTRRAYRPKTHHYTIETENQDLGTVMRLIDDSNVNLTGECTFDEAIHEFQRFVTGFVRNIQQRLAELARKDALSLSDGSGDLDDNSRLNLGSDIEIEHMTTALESITGGSKGDKNDGYKGSVDTKSFFKKLIKKDTSRVSVQNEESSFESYEDPDLVDERLIREAREFSHNFSSDPEQYMALLANQVLRLEQSLNFTVSRCEVIEDNTMGKTETTMRMNNLQQQLEDLRQHCDAMGKGLEKYRRAVSKVEKKVKTNDPYQSFARASRDPHQPRPITSNASNVTLDLKSLQKLVGTEVKRIVREQVDQAVENRLLSMGLETDNITTSSTHANLAQKVAILESQVYNQESANDNVNFGTNPTAFDPSLLQNDIATLEFKVQLLESRNGSRKLTFGNIQLESLADTQLFVNDEVPSCSYGCFMDLVALLDSLRDTQTTESDFVKIEHDIQKVKFVSVTEASTSASFLHITPLCFCGTALSDRNSAIGSVEKNLSLVKTREAWSSPCGTLGLCHNLEMEVDDKIRSLETNIDITLDGSKGKDLAIKFLLASQQCFGKFVLWTEKFYKEICATSKVSDKEAWTCVLECWMGFFHDLRRVRVDCASVSPAGMALHSAERKGVVARYIYTMGKAIQVQNNYMEKNFRNHTTIASVINYHLFKHRAPLSMISTLDKSIKDLLVFKTQSIRDIKKLEQKVNNN